MLPFGWRYPTAVFDDRISRSSVACVEPAIISYDGLIGMGQGDRVGQIRRDAPAGGRAAMLLT